MPRYSDKQKAALDRLMKDDVYSQATEIITAEGLGALTMDRLARGVGVSRGTLYNYFDDRDAVVDYVETRTFTPLLDRLEQIGAGTGRAERKLETMVREVLARVADNRTLLVALLPGKLERAGRRHHVERRDRILKTLERVIGEGIDSGRFSDLPPDQVSRLLFGLISGVIEQMVFEEGLRAPESIVPTLMQILLRGLSATPRE